MKIPFVDLHAQYLSIQSEIDAAIKNVITETAFIGGRYVSQFEKDFASWLQVKHVISCANGTDSMEIILKAWGIGSGDEVIIPAMTWISTAEAVSNVGAKPVFADVDEHYYTLNPEALQEKINSNTKAIIPVHLYGQCADMPGIMEIAKKHNLKVLEDCAQSHGAEIMSKKAGLWGDAASFSFYPGKNLGSYGDAGCMTTNDEVTAENCRIIANHGQKGKHNHLKVGRNSRMDGMQAAILSAKLPFLDMWNSKRQDIADFFDHHIDPDKYKIPVKRTNGKHVSHVYTVGCKENRAIVMNKLEEKGISTSIHYPVELPNTMPYKSHEIFINARNLANKHLSIPIYPELSETQMQYIIDTLNSI